MPHHHLKRHDYSQGIFCNNMRKKILTPKINQKGYLKVRQPLLSYQNLFFN